MRVLVVLLAALPLSVALLAHVGERALAEPRLPSARIPPPDAVKQAEPGGRRLTTSEAPVDLALLLEHSQRDLASGERPRVIPRARWDENGAVPSGLYGYRGDLGRRFTHVVVHHSDFDPARGPAGILRYHLDVARFADIGYHFVVEPDGRIYEGRDLRFMGAHAGFTREQRAGGRAKDPDFGAIGVVLDGYFEDELPDERQLRAALALVKDLRQRFAIPRAHVIGHGEVAEALVSERGLTLGSSPTSCPGRMLLKVLRAYRALDVQGQPG